jgi:hypothetical protein
MPEDGVQVYFHARVLMGVVVALAVTRILSGLPKFIQQWGHKPLCATHLLWVFTVLLMAVHFWWFEFGLIRIHPWRFELFVFVLFYAFLFYLMATVLVPDDVGTHPDYEEFFMARRGSFFGLLAASVPVDLADTLIKSGTYYASLGPEYPVRLAVQFLLCIVAIRTSNRWFHLAFAGLYLVYYASWVLRLYNVLE